MTTVSQPTVRPTNKLSAAVVTVALMEVARVLVSNVAPDWYDQNLWGALTPLVAFGVAYFIKDRPNV